MNEIADIKIALEEAQPFLDKMGQLVSDGAKFSYEVLLRQQYVKVAQVGLGWLLFTPVVYLFLKCLRNLLKETADSDNIFDLKFAGVIVLGIVVLLLVIPLIIESFQAVGILINPNYYVIRDLIDLIRGPQF